MHSVQALRREDHSSSLDLFFLRQYCQVKGSVRKCWDSQMFVVLSYFEETLGIFLNTGWSLYQETTTLNLS